MKTTECSVKDEDSNHPAPYCAACAGEWYRYAVKGAQKWIDYECKVCEEFKKKP